MQTSAFAQDTTFFANPSIQWSPALPPFGAEWSFFTLNVTRVDAAPVRKQLTRSIAWQFRHLALATLPRAIQNQMTALGGYLQIHHILPLSIGGNNHLLALVPEPLHLLIHQFVHQQTRSMQIGQSQCVTIPWREGLVWPPAFADFYDSSSPLFCQQKPPAPIMDKDRPVQRPTEKGRHPAPFAPNPRNRPALNAARF